MPAPFWSPDSATVYFRSGRVDNIQIYRKPWNSDGAEELLLSDGTSKTPDCVSADGKFMLFDRVGEKTKTDIWILPLAEHFGAKPEPRVFLQTPFDERSAQFSPDGRWVAYDSDESGRYEVYVAPFPGPGGKRQISSGGGQGATWRRDGKELIYSTSDGQGVAAEIVTRNGTVEVGRIEKLLTCPLGCDMSADGQKFIAVDEIPAPSPPLILIQNWPALLRK